MNAAEIGSFARRFLADAWRRRSSPLSVSMPIIVATTLVGRLQTTDFRRASQDARDFALALVDGRQQRRAEKMYVDAAFLRCARARETSSLMSESTKTICKHIFYCACARALYSRRCLASVKMMRAPARACEWSKSSVRARARRRSHRRLHRPIEPRAVIGESLPECEGRQPTEARTLLLPPRTPPPLSPPPPPSPLRVVRARSHRCGGGGDDDACRSSTSIVNDTFALALIQLTTRLVVVVDICIPLRCVAENLWRLFCMLE